MSSISRRDRHRRQRERVLRARPGRASGVHTDSAEEFLIILEGEGEGLVGEETAPVRAGDVVVVPAMVRHGLTNTGTEVLRVFGTFAGSTNIGTFEEPIAEGGPQVFVVGGPMPIALPLETAARTPEALTSYAATPSAGKSRASSSSSGPSWSISSCAADARPLEQRRGRRGAS